MQQKRIDAQTLATETGASVDDVQKILSVLGFDALTNFNDVSMGSYNVGGGDLTI